MAQTVRMDRLRLLVIPIRCPVNADKNALAVFVRATDWTCQLRHVWEVLECSHTLLYLLARTEGRRSLHAPTSSPATKELRILYSYLTVEPFPESLVRPVFLNPKGLRPVKFFHQFFERYAMLQVSG